jgi:hypothetical protein
MSAGPPSVLSPVAQPPRVIRAREDRQLLPQRGDEDEPGGGSWPRSSRRGYDTGSRPEPGTGALLAFYAFAAWVAVRCMPEVSQNYLSERCGFAGDTPVQMVATADLDVVAADAFDRPHEHFGSVIALAGDELTQGPATTSQASRPTSSSSPWMRLADSARTLARCSSGSTTWATRPTSRPPASASRSCARYAASLTETA